MSDVVPTVSRVYGEYVVIRADGTREAPVQFDSDKDKRISWMRSNFSSTIVERVKRWLRRSN